MAQPFEDAGKFGKEMLDTSLKSLAAMSKSAQALAAEATEYSRKSYETGSATMEKLFAAKSLETAIEIQTDYAKTSYESYVAEMTKMGEIYAELAKEAYKPFEAMVAKTR